LTTGQTGFPGSEKCLAALSRWSGGGRLHYRLD